MVLALDEFVPEEQRQEILAICDVYTATLAKLLGSSATTQKGVLLPSESSQ